jgi:hypothetical protein
LTSNSRLEKRTQVGHPAMSVWCHYRTPAVQQKDYSINSSARARCPREGVGHIATRATEKRDVFASPHPTALTAARAISARLKLELSQVGSIANYIS